MKSRAPRFDQGAAPAARSRVNRLDRGELAKPEETPDGFLRVEGVLARCTILHYTNADGTPRHELVTPEQLFDSKSMDSLSVLALTNDHPSSMLSPDTVSNYQVGAVGQPRRDGDRLVSRLGVLKRDAIEAVKSGKAALSCGYTCELDETPGEHATYRCPECGTNKYDAIQIDRRGNHVALCDAGRAGDEARIRLDSTGNAARPLARDDTPVVASPSPAAAPQPESSMDTITIGGITYKLDAANFPAIKQAIDREMAAAASRADSAEKAKQAAEQIAKDIKAKFDGYTGRVKAFVAGIGTRLDKMMKRDVVCDECAGEKNIDGVKCPSCDGMGSVSARDAMQAMPVKDGETPPDEDVAEVKDELEREPKAEEELEKKANPEHADALKASAKKRADQRAAAIERRRAGLLRRTDRRAAARAGLLAIATKHGVEEKFDGKPDLEVKRAIGTKLDAAACEWAKADAQTVEVLYTAALKRADSAGAGASSQAPGASSTVVPFVPNITPPASSGGGRSDAKDPNAAIEAANASVNDAWKPKAATK